MEFVQTLLAFGNIRFSSLFAAEDVSPGGTSATQRQKFHNDDANQCLINPVVMGFQMQIYSILRFSWSILVSVVFICERAPAKLKCLF